MYEELKPDGSTRMVGTIMDLYHQSRLKNRNKVNDEFTKDVWEIFDSAANLLIAKHHDYGCLLYTSDAADE